MADRRAFLTALGAGSLAALAPVPARSATARVVVVGGGMAGATAAKYLRMWSGGAIDVTLVERETRYASNIMSNLVLNGQRTMSSLYYSWSNLVKKYGVKLLAGTVTAIEPGGALGAWKVTVVNGATTTVKYCERIVLAPGISFDAVQETGAAQGTAASILHAWTAGAQTDALRARLVAMPAGSNFVMTIPKAPYRCPPGPYERACVVADWLRRNKPGSKVILLDANPSIQAERENFTYAFQTMYGSAYLEYVPDTSVVSVASASNVVTTNWGSFAAGVLNVIPQHRAGAIVRSVGLADTGANPWAWVDPVSFESAVSGIHVLGDSCSSGLPKAGHVGNQEAKICADAIVRAFNLSAPDPAPVANSACYSPLSSTVASWLTAVYQYDAAARKMVPLDYVSGTRTATEAARPSTGNFSKMTTWFNALMLDTFA